MRIALAGTFAGRGGIQTHLGCLARTLTNAGHELLLVSFAGTGRDSNEEVANKLLNESRVQLEFVGKGGAVPTLLAVRRVLKAFQPDVYFACGTGWNLFAGAILCRVPKLVFHEVMSGESSGWTDSRKLVRKFFHSVVAQARPVAENFARSFRWQKPIEVIPAFSQPLEVVPLPLKHSVPLGAARAAVFGRLVPHKRIAWLVSQWPRLKKCLRELHIHGSGPEEKAMRDLIAKNDWQHEVFCHGAYPDGEAYAELMASYDLTLLPTVGAEGAPLVLLESMACGVPFVATDAGGISDYTNPDCIIAPAQDFNSFLDSVDNMAVRLTEGKINQPRLQEFYRSHFSHAALAPRWIGYFEGLNKT